jgi:hypothetical protein
MTRRGPWACDGPLSGAKSTFERSYASVSEGPKLAGSDPNHRRSPTEPGFLGIPAAPIEVARCCHAVGAPEPPTHARCSAATSLDRVDGDIMKLLTFRDNFAVV